MILSCQRLGLQHLEVFLGRLMTDHHMHDQDSPFYGASQPCIQMSHAPRTLQRAPECLEIVVTIQCKGTQKMQCSQAALVYRCTACRMCFQKFAGQHGVSPAHDSTGRVDLRLRLQPASELSRRAMTLSHCPLSAQTCSRQNCCISLLRTHSNQEVDNIQLNELFNNRRIL